MTRFEFEYRVWDQAAAESEYRFVGQFPIRRNCRWGEKISMASLSEGEVTNRGSMWELDQNLDRPMDEEAGRLKNMYREKVWHFFFSFVSCWFCFLMPRLEFRCKISVCMRQSISLWHLHSRTNVPLQHRFYIFTAWTIDLPFVEHGLLKLGLIQGSCYHFPIQGKNPYALFKSVVHSIPNEITTFIQESLDRKKNASLWFK